MFFTSTTANPLIPGAFSTVVLLIVLLTVVLFIAALVSIARTRHASGLSQPLWIIIVLAFPVIGPILWFLVGRGAASTGDAERSHGGGPTSR